MCLLRLLVYPVLLRAGRGGITLLVVRFINCGNLVLGFPFYYPQLLAQSHICVFVREHGFETVTEVLQGRVAHVLIHQVNDGFGCFRMHTCHVGLDSLDDVRLLCEFAPKFASFAGHEVFVVASSSWQGGTDSECGLVGCVDHIGKGKCVGLHHFFSWPAT